MKAIMIMFDTLNRHFLPNYGCDETIAPNFNRLGAQSVTFDNSYVGSMPCMPARRELHTGRLNFLHRSWSPLEPFDDSMPEILKKNGIYTHLISDHQHYWEDGGATYHQRYNTWESVRGQEGDRWKANLSPDIKSETFFGGFGGGNLPDGMLDFHRQDAVNRTYFKNEEDFPQSQTFRGGLEFIETNHEHDNWFIQIETFDPHEPFFSTSDYQELYPKGGYDGPDYDWPPYGPCDGDEELVEHLRRKYKALLTMCDRNLGKILDAMDKYNMWEDTMLIVNTDHGYLLGEHQWWSKSIMPLYDEICHTPLFIWDPRGKKMGMRNREIVQTIDLAPTLLDYFGVPIPKDMQGMSLGEVIGNNGHTRDYAIFGYHGAHVNITDGRYVYMQAPEENVSGVLYEYTLMPCHMRTMFTAEELATIKLHQGFSFTKGCKVMKIEASVGVQQFSPWHRYGDKLYDLKYDPKEQNPVDDKEMVIKLINAMIGLMKENDAPIEQYTRLGLPEKGDMTMQMLEERMERHSHVFVPQELSEFCFTRPAAEQIRVLMALSAEKGNVFMEKLISFLRYKEMVEFDTAVIEEFASESFDESTQPMVMQVLRLAARKE